MPIVPFLPALITAGGALGGSALVGGNKPGSSEGQAGLSQIMQLIQQVMGNAAPGMDQGNSFLQQFLGGQGIFANPELGANGALGNIDALKNFQANYQPGLTGFSMPPEITQMLQSLSGGMDRSSDIANNFGQTPSSATASDFLKNLMNSDQFSAIKDFGINRLQSGGMTPELQNVVNSGYGLLQNGGMTDGLTDMQNTGRGILAAGGNTPATDVTMDQLLRTLVGQGQTDQTKSMFSQGQGLVSSGGMTPQMSSLMGQIQGLMGQGGMTPEARQLFNAVMPIVQSGGQGGALLPMQQVQSFARDAAATASSQQAEAARRDAMRRQGSAVGAGTTEQALAEFGDQSAQNEAKAVRDATTGQQTLQLQQLLGAMGVGGDITKSATSLLGQLAGSGADITRSAASNISTGSGMMSDAAKVAASRESNATSGIGNISQIINSRLGMGAGMISDADKAALARVMGGGSMVNDSSKIASGNVSDALNALGGLNNFSGDIGKSLTSLAGIDSNTFSDAIRNLVSGAGTGANIISGQQQNYLTGKGQDIDSFLKSIGLSSSINTDFTKQFLDASGQVTDIGKSWLSLLPSLFGGYSGIFGNYLKGQQQPSMFDNLFQGLLGGVLTGVGSNVGKTISAPKSPGGGPNPGGGFDTP